MKKLLLTLIILSFTACTKGNSDTTPKSSPVGVVIPANCSNFKVREQACIKCDRGYSLDIYNTCITAPTPNCHSTSPFRDEKSNIKKNKCDQCDEGYSLDIDNNTCVIEPIPNCRKIKNGVCTSCNIKYNLDRTKKCIAYPDHCFLVKSGTDNVCSWCDEGYSLDRDDKCVREPTPNCREIRDGVCTSCNSIYTLTQTNECLIFPDNCSTINRLGECVICDRGYIVINGRCRR